MHTFLGYQAGYASSTGSTNAADSNIGIGFQSLYSNASGNNNTAIGVSSLRSNSTGIFNTANGANALFSNTTGNNNTAIGYSALYSNTVGGSNVATGRNALYSNTSGDFNSAYGYSSLNNTATGHQAGRYLTDGSSAASTTDYSVFLGTDTKALTNNDQNSIVIGYNANGLGSNTVVLGNDSITTTALKGKVGIGTTTPNAVLSIATTSVSSAGVAGLDQYFSFTNSTPSAVQFANQMYVKTTNTATTTLVGSMLKLEDNTTFGNTVRGFEVQTDRGTNTQGENTALSGFARTFGVRGVTEGDAGAVYEPAGVFGETQGTTQGNAIRGYSSTITSAALLKLFQDTSAFT